MKAVNSGSLLAALKASGGAFTRRAAVLEIAPFTATPTPSPTPSPTPTPTTAPTPAVPTCGGTTYLVASQTPIQISDGSLDYPSNKYCVWVVTGNGKISVKFSLFETEASYDFVKIYDGASANSGLLKSFSGTSTPGLVTSNGNAMTIVFSSDVSVEKQGFIASITAAADPARRDCGASPSVLRSKELIYISDGPVNYARLADCQWQVQATGLAPNISVSFTAFATEFNYDFVKIYSGRDAATGRLQAVFSGGSANTAVQIKDYTYLPTGNVTVNTVTVAPAVLTQGGYSRTFINTPNIVISFSSDDTVEDAGFQATVVAVAAAA